MKLQFYCNGFRTISFGLYLDRSQSTLNPKEKLFDLKIFLIFWTLCIYRQIDMNMKAPSGFSVDAKDLHEYLKKQIAQFRGF